MHLVLYRLRNDPSMLVRACIRPMYQLFRPFSPEPQFTHYGLLFIPSFSCDTVLMRHIGSGLSHPETRCAALCLLAYLSFHVSHTKPLASWLRVFQLVSSPFMHHINSLVPPGLILLLARHSARHIKSTTQPRVEEMRADRYKTLSYPHRHSSV